MALEKRFQRLGADVKPVADNEIYEVARARLFESIAPENEADYPDQIARIYQDMYAKHSGEVPAEAAKSTYRKLIQRAYPFHPLLIDTLYTRWGSNPDLQRTRGVLQLLASIVGDLWQRRRGSTQTQHLIQPCHIRWSIDAVQAALTRLWGPPYQSVAAADVIGERSNAGIFDEERGDDYRSESIGEGLASAILLGSFGGQGGRSGFSAKDLKLACSRHGLNWNYTDGALLELEDRSFYLHTIAAGSLGKRYWFGTKPTLNKLIVQYRQQSTREDFTEQIIENLRTESRKSSSGSATWRVIVDPAQDLPEQRSLALLILSPSLAWDNEYDRNDMIQEYVKSINSLCGQKERLYRNTLLYLVGTKHGLSRLRKAHRTWVALEGVRTDYWNQLDEDQQEDLKKRLNTSRQAVYQALGSAYTVILRVRGAEIDAFPIMDARQTFQEHLGYIWTTLVEEEEWILRRVGSVTLESTGLILKKGSLRLKDAIQAYLRYTDKPMIAAKEAVTAGLTRACADGLIGIGRGGSPSALQSKYCRQSISLDPSEDGLWIIPAFEPEVEEVHQTKETFNKNKAESNGTETGGPTIPEEKTADDVPVKNIVVQGEVSVEQWAELFRCFVNPAARMNLKKLGLGIQIEMIPPEGEALHENDRTFKSMKESAEQLGLNFTVEK